MGFVSNFEGDSRSDETSSFPSCFSFSALLVFLAGGSWGSCVSFFLDLVTIDDAAGDFVVSAAAFFLEPLVAVWGLAAGVDLTLGMGGLEEDTADDAFSSFTVGRGRQVMKGLGAALMDFKHWPDSFKVLCIALK